MTHHTNITDNSSRFTLIKVKYELKSYCNVYYICVYVKYTIHLHHQTLHTLFYEQKILFASPLLPNYGLVANACLIGMPVMLRCH